MKSEDKLFELINSLTPHEKGYFKKYSRSKSALKKGENYLKLFNALNESEVYDEKYLKKIFANEKFIRQLGVAKNYLYELILESLVSFHSESNGDIMTGNMFNKFYVLFARGLPDHADSSLRKIKKKIEEKKASVYRLPEVLHFEKHIKTHNPHENYLRRAKDINKEEISLYKELSEISQYHYLAMEFENIMTGILVIRTNEQLKIINKFMKQTLLKDTSHTMSTTGKLYFYMINSVYYRLTGDNSKSYEMSLKMFEMYNAANPDKESNFIQYSNVYHEFLYCCNSTGNYAKLKSEAEKFRKIMSAGKNKNNRIIINNVFNSYILELQANIFLGEPQSNFKIIDIIETEFKKHEKIISVYHTIERYHYIALTYFVTDNHELALSYANKIINFPEIKNKFELFYIKINILCLLIHFELGNFELLDSLIRSVYYFISKQKNPLLIEKEILMFIKKLPGINNNKELINLFRDLKYKISILIKDSFQKNVFEDLEIYMKYLDSKIKGITLEETFKVKLSK